MNTMADRWKGASGPAALGRKIVEVTPGASDLADGVAKTVVALSSGNVTIVPADNDNADTITFTGVQAGWHSPVQVRRVTAATATVGAVYD